MPFSSSASIPNDFAGCTQRIDGQAEQRCYKLAGAASVNMI